MGMKLDCLQRHNDIAAFLKKNYPNFVSPKQIEDNFADDPGMVRLISYRLSVYIRDIRLYEGGIVIVQKNGGSVIGYQLQNAPEFDERGVRGDRKIEGRASAKGRGRPAGSKNKPKETVPAPVVGAATMIPGTPATSLVPPHSRPMTADEMKEAAHNNPDPEMDEIDRMLAEMSKEVVTVEIVPDVVQEVAEVIADETPAVVDEVPVAEPVTEPVVNVPDISRGNKGRFQRKPKIDEKAPEAEVIAA